MPDASLRVLKEFFTNHMNFTPTAADIVQFEEDLAVVSPSLMRASLAEISHTRLVKSGRARDWREAIYRVYNRKVAEHAQLFPLFHSFETAFRSTTAVTLEHHYRETKWWEPVRVALLRGNPKAVTAIGGVPISTDIAIAVSNVVEDLIQKRIVLASIHDGYQFLEATDLSRIGSLIVRHWSVFKPLFIRNSVHLSLDHFKNKFERIRLARNAVYHHTSFSGFTDVYQTAEDLLAYLNFPLKRVHENISSSKCAPPQYLGLLT